jgi:VWFA-related protein
MNYYPKKCKLVGKYMKTFRLCEFWGLVLCFIVLAFNAFSQDEAQKAKQNVRTVTIPISIFTKKELQQDQAAEYIQADRLFVKEDKDEQTILSIRSITDTPLTVAFLMQDDLGSSFNLQLKSIAEFIRKLPKGSRVMVAYMRTGSLQVRQKFTDDLAKAAGSLRIVASTSSAAPRSPYEGVTEALNRFDALPAGRRAIVIFSDGLDATQGLSFASATNTPDLERAILRAQRKSVAVYSIYSPATFTESENSSLVLTAQGGLEKLSDETGGRAFFQGLIAPISLDPFFKDLSILLSRQFALTYLSTHMNKGYHKVDVRSTNPEVKIEHPRGYYYR